MIKNAESESQIQKILEWIEEDIAARYPLIGVQTLIAAEELNVKPELFFIANRRISFGVYKLNAKKKEIKVVTIKEEKKTKPRT
jgi:predicted transcriptional regulator